MLGEDQLQGDGALERELLGSVDDAHVSVADELLDTAPGNDGAPRERGGRRLPGCDRGCRGAGRVRAGAGGGVAGAGGAGGCPAPVTCSVVEPTRTESPTLSSRLAADALAVHEGPVRRPEILDRQPAVRLADDAGVAARELVVVVQPPLSAHLPPDDELVRQREPATRARPGGDHQLLHRRGRRRRGRTAAPAPARHRSCRSRAGPSCPPGRRHRARASAERRCARRSRTSRSPTRDPRSSADRRPRARSERGGVRARDRRRAVRPRRPRRGRSAARCQRSGACQVPRPRSPATALRPSRRTLRLCRGARPGWNSSTHVDCPVDNARRVCPASRRRPGDLRPEGSRGGRGRGQAVPPLPRR